MKKRARSVNRVTRPRWWVMAALGAVLMLAAGVSACGSGSSDEGDGDTIDIALLHGNVMKDGGYAAGMLQAVEGAMDDLGADKFNLKTVEKVPYTAQMTSTAEQLLQQNDLLIDIASGAQLIYDACEKFPDKQCIEWYPIGDPPENVTGAWVDEAPYFYLEGVAAGKLTKTGVVGFVGAVKGNLARAVENSFLLGCQSVRPDCEVRVIYINSFSNPPKAAESARTLIDGGADVIGHFMNDSSVLKAADQRGVWSFGFYADQRDVAPETYVNAFVYWPSFQESVKKVLADMLEGKPVEQRIDYGTPEPMDVALAPWGENVPDDVQKAVEEAYDRINSGESPYAGPIEDSKGNVRVKEGEEIDPRSEFVFSGWTWAAKGLTGG